MPESPKTTGKGMLERPKKERQQDQQDQTEKECVKLMHIYNRQRQGASM